MGFFFFRAGKRQLLCADCGTLLGNTHRQKHLVSASHAEAGASERYRHRDDSPHSVTGQADCYVCVELRRIAREGERAHVPTLADGTGTEK